MFFVRAKLPIATRKRISRKPNAEPACVIYCEWWLAVSDGSQFNNQLWTTWNPNVTWVDVQVGDFNNDGKLDLAGRVQ
jgi:hypothetical protein